MSRKNKNKETKNSTLSQNKQAVSESSASEQNEESTVPAKAVETAEAAAETETAACTPAQGENKEMYIQFGDHEVSVNAIFDKVKQECQEAWQEEVKDIRVYVKPQDNRAYYVLNGEIEGSVGLV